MARTRGPLPSVSVVVPTHDRADLLDRVLAPLLADPAATEVIVVDDGSGDATPQVLHRLAAAHPTLRTLRTTNQGAAGARSHGLHQATGDVVLFVDDDVLAEPDHVSRHARWHAEHDGTVLVAYTPNRPSRPRRPGQFAEYLYATEYESLTQAWDRGEREVLRNLWGSSFSLGRAACTDVGVSSPEWVSPVVTNPYHEDQEFGLRCRAAGLVGYFDRSVRAEHLYVRSPRQFVRDAQRQGAGRLLLHRLHEDVLGPLTPSHLVADLPTPVRLAIGVLSGPRMWPGVGPVLLATVRVAGWLRAWRWETGTARVLRRVAQLEAARRAATAATTPTGPGETVRSG